jgi:hypothetical protein
MSAYQNDALTEFVKKHLRLTGDTMDDEVKGLIAAALDDMNMRGIDVDASFPETAAEIGDLKPLAVRAVVYYCKANFGIAVDTAESAQYATRYDGLTQCMSCADEYRIAPAAVGTTDETES